MASKSGRISEMSRTGRVRLRGEATTAPGMVAVAAAASVLFCVCATGCGQRGAASHPAGLTAEEAAFQQRLQEQLLDARPGTVIEIAPGKHLLDRVLTLRADGVTIRGACGPEHPVVQGSNLRPGGPAGLRQ